MSTKDYGKIIISWNFPEFTKYQRTRWWYIVSAVIGILLIIYSVVTANILFALIVIMFIIITLMHTIKEPTLVNFKITEDGLVVGEKFFSYEEFKDFWIVYNPPEVKKLFIDFKSGFRPHLTIELEKQNPIEIRKILLEYMEENLDRENEPPSEELGRWLKI